MYIESSHFKPMYVNMYTKLNSVTFSPQANYIERPPLVGEVSANFCG
jgi:hypothetical protein